MKLFTSSLYRGGVKALYSFLFLLSLSVIFPACKNQLSSSWEEPVQDYFDKYTNTAAIEKQVIGVATLKDSTDATCLSSDGDKTVTFYLRNPREYTLDMEFDFPDATFAPQQDTEDKTVVRITYPQSFLLDHEGGGFIGGTISLREHETQRAFDSYSFSLKCNTPPPAVTGQCVNVSGGNYWVCFYLPTAELDGQTHGNDSHTVYINGVAVAKRDAGGAVTALPGKNISTSSPSDLAEISGSGAGLFSGSASGCTAVYYDTGVTMSEGKYIQWEIQLSDDDGLKSRKTVAASIVTPVNLSVSGEDLLTTEEDNKTTSLTVSTDSGTIASSEWTCEQNNVTVTPNTENPCEATVTASSGGEATINITVTLADGRVVTKTKTIHVLSVDFEADCPTHFLKGESGILLTADAPDFATLSWSLGSSSIASVTSTGSLTALEKGSAELSVTASYGGKSLSKTKNVYVHEVTVTGASEAFVGGSNLTLTANLLSPPSAPSPSGITYQWSSSSDARATVTSGSPTATVTPVASGTATITLKALHNGKTTSLATKSITIYDLAISVTPPSSISEVNGSTSGTAPLYALTSLSDQFSLSVTNSSSLPTGTTYSWTITGGSSVAKNGASSTVAPSTLGTISENKTSPTSVTVKCKATLPSGAESPEKTVTFKAYKLVMPNFTIEIESIDGLKEDTSSSSGSKTYYVFSSSSLPKRLKFTATPTASASFPAGTQFSWSLLPSATPSPSISASINTICSGTIPPSESEYTVTCSASLQSLNSDTKNVKFKLKKGSTVPSISKKSDPSAGIYGSGPGSVISGFTFSSDTNIDNVKINYDWNIPSFTRPEGMLLSYGLYVNGQHIYTAPERLNPDGSIYNNNTGHFTTVEEIADVLGEIDWGVSLRFSIRAWPQGTSFPGWEESSLVDLFTITLTRQD